MVASRVLLALADAERAAAYGRAFAESFAVTFAGDGRRALEIALGEPAPEIVLLDLALQGPSALEILRRLQAGPHRQDLPVVVLSASPSPRAEAEALALGAADFVALPAEAAPLAARIRTHLARKRRGDRLKAAAAKSAREIVAAQLEVAACLARAAEYRDDESGGHVDRMRECCGILARAAGLDEERSALVFHASALHDVGKIGVPDRILLKPGKLDPEEWRVMQTHAQIGADLLRRGRSPLLRLASEIAWSHHERWDGLGYPRRLRGAEIPLAGRIVALCDVFDALTSERPYKKAWSVEAAAAEIRNQRDRQFDPELTDLFSRCLPEIRSARERHPD